MKSIFNVFPLNDKQDKNYESKTLLYRDIKIMNFQHFDMDISKEMKDQIFEVIKKLEINCIRMHAQRNYMSSSRKKIYLQRFKNLEVDLDNIIEKNKLDNESQEKLFNYLIFKVSMNSIDLGKVAFVDNFVHSRKKSFNNPKKEGLLKTRILQL